MRRYAQACALSAVAALAIQCGNSGTAPSTTGPPPSPPPVATTAFLIGAGDIADCTYPVPGVLGIHAEETAKLLDTNPEGMVFAAGDLAYFQGNKTQFATCYDPRWGRHKNRTWPSPGNHEYETPGAADYAAYWGEAAGPFGSFYYSHDLGAWHIVSLDSNVSQSPGSPQWNFLREDLTASHAKCTLVYWHHPRFTSGPSGGGPGVMADIWQLLMDFKVDVVVNGHDHFYERFAPQDGNGLPTPNGVREFIVGTGGAQLYPLVARRPNSEVLLLNTYGVIKFTLHPDTYEWAFLEAGTGAIKDSSVGSCH